MRRFTALLLIFTSSTLRAQISDFSLFYLFNDIGLTVRNTAGLYSESGAAVMLGNQISRPLVKRLDFWITGIKGSDTVALAADMYSKSTNWTYGPSALNSGKFRLISGDQRWPGIWDLGRKDIDFHRKNFNSSSYYLPKSLETWPGSFLQSGFPSNLAPFADVNVNGTYEAALGDYPFLPGERNVFSMGSDSVWKNNSGSAPINADMSVLWFNQPKTDDISGNLVFFRLTICNRDTKALNNACLSVAADFEIGSRNDDYLSTDVANHTLIGLNADNNDALLGQNPPLVAVGFLSINSAHSMYFENSIDAVKGKPLKPTHFYNLAAGKWKTGTRLGFGGSGLDATVAADYVFPGITHPGKPAMWSESSEGNAPGPRTGVLSTDTFNLNAFAGCKVIDGFILVASSTNWTDSFQIKEILKQVRDKYNQSDFTLSQPRIVSQIKPQIWPVPCEAGMPLNVGGVESGEYCFSLLNGQTALCGKIEGNKIHTPRVPGTYILRLGRYRSLVIIKE